MNFLEIFKILFTFLTIKLVKIREIHDSFFSIPFGNSIGHYLATTFLRSPNRKNHVLLDIMRARRYGNHNFPEMVNVSQLEMNYVRCRNTFLIQNQEAYSLAWTENPTVPQLEAFSRLKQNWSILICVKTFLIHHPDLAKEYRGFLPYGLPVATFMSKMLSTNETPVVIEPSPSLERHIELMNITNAVAKFLNLTTVEVNTLFYLEGVELLNNLRASTVPVNTAINNGSTTPGLASETGTPIIRTPYTDEAEAENEAN